MNKFSQYLHTQYPRTYFFWNFLLISAIVLAISIPLLDSETARAQSGSWSVPIPLYNGKGISYPLITADRAGGIHVFWTISESGDPFQSTIFFYTHWDGENWSTPVDVIISPDIIATPSVVIDRENIMHLIWSGGRAFCHASVPVYLASDPHEWVYPSGGCASDVDMYAVDAAVDETGTIHVAYSITGGEVYYIQSIDGGKTWSSASQVSNTPVDEVADQVTLAVDERGRIHVAWSQAPIPELYPPTGVFYSRSLDNGKSWSPAFDLGIDYFSMPNIITIGEDIVHVVWSGAAAIRGRYHRWSQDGGETWSPVYEPIPRGQGAGMTWLSALEKDASGTLYLIPSTEGESFYTTWNGREWTPLVDLPRQFGLSFIDDTKIAISEGNKIHVIYKAADKIWYTNSQSSAPIISLDPILTSTPTPSQTPVPTITPRPVSTADPTLINMAPAGNRTSPGMPITFAMLPVLFIIILFMLRTLRTNRRQ